MDHLRERCEEAGVKGAFWGKDSARHTARRVADVAKSSRATQPGKPTPGSWIPNHQICSPITPSSQHHHPHHRQPPGNHRCIHRPASPAAPPSNSRGPSLYFLDCPLSVIRLLSCWDGRNPLHRTAPPAHSAHQRKTDPRDRACCCRPVRFHPICSRARPRAQTPLASNSEGRRAELRNSFICLLACPWSRPVRRYFARQTRSPSVSMQPHRHQQHRRRI